LPNDDNDDTLVEMVPALASATITQHKTITEKSLFTAQKYDKNCYKVSIYGSLPESGIVCAYFIPNLIKTDKNHVGLFSSVIAEPNKPIYLCCRN
jgi:hypothetical protein